MGTEIACRAKAQLLLIDCKIHMDGNFYHTAFEGRQRIVTAGFDRILSPEGCEEMRKAPIMYVSWCKRQ